MLTQLLQFLVVIVLFAFLAVLVMVLMLYGKVRKAMRSFGNHQPQGQSRPRSDREEVIDPRTKREAGRKIIGKDEGEYVDFVEADD